MTSHHDRNPSSLTHSVQAGADSAQIAESVVVIFGGIDLALTPIIGQRGVAALFKRSLHLASQKHNWLAGLHDGVLPTMEVAPLKAALVQQTPAAAAAGGELLLYTFYELLTTLVGPSLTERLLRSVWATYFSGPPAQDFRNDR